MRVDLILCEHCDESLQNIKNVFTEIKRDRNDEISFTIVSKVTYEKGDSENNIIHFFIIKHQDDKIRGLYLSEVDLVKENNDEESFKAEWDSVPVEGCGKYSITVVQNNDMKDAPTKQGGIVFNTGTIVGEIFFEVK